jgi:hypothetical protein
MPEIVADNVKVEPLAMSKSVVEFEPSPLIVTDADNDKFKVVLLFTESCPTVKDAEFTAEIVLPVLNTKTSVFAGVERVGLQFAAVLKLVFAPPPVQV